MRDLVHSSTHVLYLWPMFLSSVEVVAVAGLAKLTFQSYKLQGSQSVQHLSGEVRRLAMGPRIARRARQEGTGAGLVRHTRVEQRRSVQVSGACMLGLSPLGASGLLSPTCTSFKLRCWVSKRVSVYWRLWLGQPPGQVRPA